MSPAPMVCERCGDALDQSYSTTAYSGVGQALRIGPDGASCIFPLGGFVACSWNCLAVLAAQKAGPKGDAAVRMVAERERQITQEGYSPEHDASMPAGHLAIAGVLYAVQAVEQRPGGNPPQIRTQTPMTAGDPGDIHEWRWPWEPEWWKPKGPERDFVRAGALLAAELDRDGARRRGDIPGEPF